MPSLPTWFRTATDRAVLRRATIFSLAAATLLSVVNHADELAENALHPSSVLQILVISWFSSSRRASRLSSRSAA